MINCHCKRHSRQKRMNKEKTIIPIDDLKKALKRYCKRLKAHVVKDLI